MNVEIRMFRLAVIFAALALLAPLAGGCAPKPSVSAEATPVVPWPNTPCRSSVEAFLGMGGLSLARMETVTVREERLNGGQPGEQVGYWSVAGRPETCTSGAVTLTILPDCSIDSWTTSGGCRIPGLEANR